jgi:hypothetical protein
VGVLLKTLVMSILPEVLYAVDSEYFFEDAVVVASLVFVGVLIDVPECPIIFQWSFDHGGFGRLFSDHFIGGRLHMISINILAYTTWAFTLIYETL